jgi:hypothetical protein
MRFKSYHETDVIGTFTQLLRAKEGENYFMGWGEDEMLLLKRGK